MFLEGRHQFGFLTGETVCPPPGDVLERLWKGEDSLIRSMLINSMKPQIGKPLLYVAIAKDLWDTTQTLYSKGQNASRLSASLYHMLPQQKICETTLASTSQSTDPTASQTKIPTLGAIAQSGMPQSFGLISVDGKNLWILASGITHELHCKAIFLPESVYFQDMSSGRTIDTAQYSRGLYILDDDTSCSSLSRVSLLSSYFGTFEQDCMLWHFRLDHPNFTYMQYLFPHHFSKLDVSSLSCDVCIRTKQHRVSFPSQPHKPTQPFTLIHRDVWGPSKVTTSSGRRWFVTFIDDHTRLTWVYLITDKSEVSSIFQNFYHTVATKFDTKIAILRSNNGRKFQNHNLSEFLTSKGIVHQTSCAYTPQQNGVAERKNRHLLKVARSLMLSTSPPSYLRGDAILTATHLINRMSSRILHLQTPLNCLKESYPSTRLVSEVPLRVFGCTAYVHNFGFNQTKFTPRVQACVFVGYPLHQRGESVSEESNSTFEFIEPTFSTVSDVDPHPIILPTNQVPWKTYYRRNLRKEVGGDETEVKIETSNDEAEQGHTRKLDEYDPSLNILIALRKEMKALEKNRTWEICALPKGHKTVGCKWVFSIKYKADGTLDRHKARFTTFVKSQGYSQGYSDHTLFTKVSKTGKIAILIVYVDDIVLTGDDQTEISQLKQRMGDEF
ncbi:Beta-galactosidase [Cucumis melo var. makuwa]|uniref:Beta-galactosidase n=1 Tax=Cucumis melo var. makuwa TaxID=1194695 RepID=A0A5D3DUN0_CUCMM|nr:Beta-galactosidase [Cucumis melo var. makuwa]TYK27383.1 Beta-galactosidase [Cucumis melo var. makuwa]